MSNMSHCRFENTLGDLEDCAEAFEEEDLSDSEEVSRLRLLELCKELADDYEYMLEG